VDRFDRAQVITFLRAVDIFLKKDLKIFLVGGAAALLGYHARGKTSDLDVFDILEGSENDLKQAAREASHMTGLAVSVGGAPVTDLPYNYEDRLKQVRGTRFKKLTVIVPDKYDLALSKMIRGYPHDLDAIRSMHAHHPLSEKVLAKRFESEIWNEAVTDKRRFALNMVGLMQLLYGNKIARRHAEKWSVA
jgi:hypothetical protein